MYPGIPVAIPSKKSGDARSKTDQLSGQWVELTIRLGVLGLLLYWSFILIRPFLIIGIWSAVLTVALYPIYDWVVGWLGGRRRLAAALVTISCILIVIGPVAWLIWALTDSLLALSASLDFTALTLPPPSERVKSWPIVGEPIHQFWQLASTNLRGALAKMAPHLKPIGVVLLNIAAGAGIGALKLLAAVVIAGCLFAPAPALARSVRMFVHRLASERGEEFVDLAVATIRAVSRGVIGISALQALLAGLGFAAAGIPVASLLTSAVLILGIIQIGPAIVLIPAIVWSWTAMDTTPAVIFTCYMMVVGLSDNALRAIVMKRGVDIPTLIILLGVVGGAMSYGMTGLFLGPIVLAVIWKLVVAWTAERGADEDCQDGPSNVVAPVSDPKPCHTARHW